MTGVSGIWMGLSLAATGWALAFGVPVELALAVLVCSSLPVVFGSLFARWLSDMGRLELEAACWIVVAALASASTGGATSTHVLWFMPALMMAAVWGDTRYRIEIAGFVVVGFGIAALAGSSGSWIDPRSNWILGICFGAALLLLSAAIALHGVSVGERPWPRWLKGRNGSEHGSADLAGDLAQARARIDVLEGEARLAGDRTRAAEAALSDRMVFFAQTSHELRTPLNAIVGFTDLMVQQVYGPLKDKYLEYARLIREGGVVLNGLVDDVTNLARIEAGRYEIAPEPVSLSDLLDEAVGFLTDMADRKSISLEFLDETDVEAFADPKAVRQIAFNLISNALKFTPSGGRVMVSASETPAGASFVVTDSGPGMTAEDKARALTPFGQGEAGKTHKGTGLGLSIVVLLADLHGGELVLSDASGGGVSASVFFPAEASKTGATGENPESDRT
jgi:signal transduction histidine kinase